MATCVAAVGREIKILRLFRHPHIIRLYDVVETTDNIYVVMEYVRVIIPCLPPSPSHASQPCIALLAMQCSPILTTVASHDAA